jgi:HEPN domain-containing protein
VGAPSGPRPEDGEVSVRGQVLHGSLVLRQQCAEKALKAVLFERTDEIMKIHDLVRLGKELNIDEEMLGDCERLTFVYIESRYPGVGDQEYTAKETEEDLRLAEAILKWAEKNLS